MQIFVYPGSIINDVIPKMEVGIKKDSKGLQLYVLDKPVETKY